MNYIELNPIVYIFVGYSIYIGYALFYLSNFILHSHSHSNGKCDRNLVIII